MGKFLGSAVTGGNKKAEELGSARSFLAREKLSVRRWQEMASVCQRVVLVSLVTLGGSDPMQTRVMDFLCCWPYGWVVFKRCFCSLWAAAVNGRERRYKDVSGDSPPFPRK